MNLMSVEFLQASCPRVRAKNRHTGSDGLRVFALLGVMAYHIRPDLVPGGFLGVVIFLVLAGYYTTRSFVVKPRLDLASYYKSRVRRLWPPLLFLVASLALYSGFLLPEVFRFLRISAPSALLGYHNIAEILADNSYFARHGSFDPLTHLWALSLEIQYYLAFPLIFAALSAVGDRLPSKLRLYGRELAGYFLLLLGLASAIYMGLAYQPGGDPTPYYYHSLMRAHAFLNGAATSLILAGRQMRQAYLVASGQVWDLREDEEDSGWRQRQHRKPQPLPLAIRSSVGWFSLLFMLAAFFLFSYDSSFLYRGGFYLYSLLAVLFIAFASVRAVPGMGFMETGLFRYLASRSYHIYLWQYALMICLEAALRFSTLSFLPRLAIQLVFLALMSELSWRLFECQGSIRPGFRNSLAVGLSLILILLLVLPPLTKPAAPALESEVVLQAIQANQERQSRLLQEEAKLSAEDEKFPPAAENAEDESESEPDNADQPGDEDEEDTDQSSAGDSAQQGEGSEDQQNSEEDTGEEADSEPVPDSPDPTADPQGEGEDASSQTPSAATASSNPLAPQAESNNIYGYSEAAVQALKDLNLVIVGDSVMAMAMTGMQAYVPGVYIDAVVSRHFFEGPAIIQAIDNSGIASDILVVALSTNGDINPPDMDTYYAVANGRPLIFVNTVVPGTWEQPNNQKLANFAASHEGVYVADWYGRAKNVPEYFYQDATHPVPLGADVYDQVILETILAVLGVQP